MSCWEQGRNTRSVLNCGLWAHLNLHSHFQNIFWDALKWGLKKNVFFRGDWIFDFDFFCSIIAWNPMTGVTFLGLYSSLFILIYDYSTSFSFCQGYFHFACVTWLLSLWAINLSLNYHSRDKLRGPPLSSASWLVLITLSLPYHTLWSSALSESYCLRQEVKGTRGMPTPTIPHHIMRSSLSHLLPALQHPSHSHPIPFSDPPNRPLQYRFIRSIKVKVVILNGLLIRPLYWAGQGGTAWRIPVALSGLDTMSYIQAAHCKEQALSVFLV